MLGRKLRLRHGKCRLRGELWGKVLLGGMGNGLGLFDGGSLLGGDWMGGYLHSAEGRSPDYF